MSSVVGALQNAAFLLTGNMTYVIYGLIIISFLPGMKLARRNEFNEGALSLEAMTSLKGIMALFVLFHHLSQKRLFQESHIIGGFEFIGYLFVGIFFFCSGYGLYKSFSTKENYLDHFPRKRILPIVVSYYLMIAIYAAYYLIAGNDFTPVQWVLKLTGLILINTQSWYVYVIVIMYFAFYLVYKNEKARKYGVLILFAVALVQGAVFVFNGHFPWWLGPKDWWKNGGLFTAPWWKQPVALLFEGEWWVNSTVAFAFGVLIAEKEKAFIEWTKKAYWLKFAVAAVLFAVMMALGILSTWYIGYWTEFGGDLGIWRKGVTYLIQSVQNIVTCFFIILVMQKAYVQNRLYKFYGKRSLEVYLIQELVILSWAYLVETGSNDRLTPIFKTANWNAAVYFILVLITVSAAAVIYNWLNVALTKKLKK